MAGTVGITMKVRLAPDAGWTEIAGIGARGAVLVRPDRFVAWRSEQDPGAAEFEQGLRVIFDK